MEIGTIIAIEKDGDRLICTVDFGEQDAITAVLYGLASQNEYPMIDDEAVVYRDGNENAIVALFRPNPDDLLPGEAIMYSRDSSGDTAASVRLGNDGVLRLNDGESGLVQAGNASDWVAMAAKVDDFISNIHTLLGTWTVTPQDGGLALQTAYKLLYPPPAAPPSVASTNLKAD